MNSGGDDVIEPGETAYLTVTLKNNGTDTATNTSMTLSETDAYITLTDNHHSYGSIAAGGNVTGTDVYTFTVASNIPDNHPIHFDAAISCEEDSWNSNINLTASNPVDITANPIHFDETLLPDHTSSDNLNIGNTGGATLDYTAILSETRRSPLLRDMINNSKNTISGDESLKISSGIIYSYTSRAYCTATGGCDEYISRIQVGDIDNSSTTCSGYADFSSISTDMTIGTGYTLILTIGNPYTSDQGGLWIDWNQDEDFEDANEEIITSWSGTGPYTVTITPPEGALTGQTRMRARLTWNTTPTACGTHTYGEVEDYSINVMSSGPEWVTIDGGSTVNGSVAVEAGNDVIIVGFNSTDLTEGIYTADIEISSNDPDEATIIVPVTLTVDSGGPPAPNILIDPTSLSQELEPDQTDSQLYDITNNGDIGTTLTYNITWGYTTTRNFNLESRPKDMSVAEYNKLYSNTRDETWLNVTPISGSCTYNETDPINCDFNSAGLIDGMYTATITISNNAVADEYVYVTLNVETPGGTTPVNPRAIAEFEPMEGVLVRYPFGVPVSLIAEMSEDVMVTTIVANAGEEATVTSTYTANGVNMTNCNFEYSPTDSYWIRDYGPWWVEDGSDDVAIIDFTYNRPRPNDNNIPGEIASYLSENIYLMGLDHTGGNYMTDGMGIAASTELIWEENSSLSHMEIEQQMEDYLGIQTYHVVPDPNGTYIDHIDCWGKFLDVDKILIREVPTGHSQYDEIEATVDYFEAQTSSFGTPYQIYRVYTPNDEPYTNSLILNDKVLVPTMDSPSSSEDLAAIAVYEAALPGYEVLGFYYSSWEGTDAIHCRLRGIADRNMLYVNHIPLSDTISNTRADYEIDATIVPYSAQPVYNDSLLVYYSVNGGVYSSVVMTHQNGNDYQGIIPEQVGGSEIAYYIHTADHSGQNADHPFIGASDPHYFVIEGQLDAPINVQIQVVGTEVQLSWDAVSGATKYHVFRSTDPYGSFARITPYPAGIPTNSHTDTSSGEKYFYYITAE